MVFCKSHVKFGIFKQNMISYLIKVFKTLTVKLNMKRFSFVCACPMSLFVMAATTFNEILKDKLHAVTISWTCIEST